ncbi:MAG: ATP-binding protein [Rhodothermales bacterium]|nr:ATP-binding protein [Rhodothermales bacterium]
MQQAVIQQAVIQLAVIQYSISCATMKMPHFLVATCAILTLMILVIDLLTAGDGGGDLPFVLGGFPYIAVILATLWLPGRNYTVFFAALTTLLSLFMLFVAPSIAWHDVSNALIPNINPPDPHIYELSVGNRLLSVFAIWITAILTIQRKRSEERSQSLGAIVQSSNDAIIGQTMDGVITYWNRGASRIYQYTAEEVVGEHISMLWARHTASAVEEEIMRKILEGNPQEPYEAVRRRKDGSEFDVSIAISPTLDERGELIGLSEIGRDITDRKKYETALIDAKEHAERVSKLKSTFLTNMSHEIRTPLSGILGFASILAQEATAEQHELAMLIEKSGRRLLDTINSVLDLSMLESDSFTLHPAEMNLAREVREKIELLQPLALEKGIELTADVPAEPCEVVLDHACLDRILNNLIGNAIKFTPRGSVQVKVFRTASHVSIRVADTGIGISKEFMDRLFNEFEQESSGMSRLYEGSGLGLSITKRLVELMNGHIEVDTQMGVGSAFTVHFLAGKQAPDEQIRRDRSRRRRATRGRAIKRTTPARVLLVEDDPQMRMQMRLLLQRACNLDLAEDEAVALTMAQRNRYDLILQDINMGRKHAGIDALQALRRLPDYDVVPVVAMTAYGLPRDREDLLQAGFDEYLCKPITEEQLFSVINQVLKED